MTGLEALEHVKTVKDELKHLECVIEELWLKLFSIKAVDYGKEPIQSGGVKDLSDQVAEFEERLEELETKRRAREAYIDAVESMIEQVRPARLKMLLHLRYINGKSWEYIAYKLELSRQWLYEELRPQALEEFDKILKNGLQKFTEVYKRTIV